MLSPKPPVAQDLQQTHTQAQLLLHAEYENHHLNPQQKVLSQDTATPGHTQQERTCNCQRNLNARLNANAFRQMWYIKHL